MNDSLQLDQEAPGGIFEIHAGHARSYQGLTVFPLISEPTRADRDDRMRSAV